MIGNYATTRFAFYTKAPRLKQAWQDSRSFSMSLDDETFPIERATTNDEADVMKFLLSDFIRREPMNESLALTPDDCYDFFLGLVRKGINSSISYVMRNSDNEVIGTKLCAFMYRNKNEAEAEKESSDQSSGSTSVDKIAGLLERLDANMWSKVPEDCDKLYYVIILSVSGNYGRRGLAKKLMEHGIDEARSLGCQGIITEASAYNSQQLFAKLGYQILSEVKHADYCDENGVQLIKCNDKTNSAQLVFKRL